MSQKLFGIGWDVGGWQGSHQAVAVASLCTNTSTVEWLGVSEAFPFEIGNSPYLIDLLIPAVGNKTAKSIAQEECLTIAIDAPLAFPKDFVGLMRNENPMEFSIPEKEIENKLAYRECERWIYDVFGKKPLSATFDKLGNNATLALMVVANLRKKGFTLIPQEGNSAHLSIIEVYPALIKSEPTRASCAIPKVACHLPNNLEQGADPYDAAICALLAILYQGGYKRLGLPELTQPPQHFDFDEGWIYTLQKEDNSMLNKNQNYHLHNEFVEYIDDVEVRDAYHVLVGAAASLEKFNCYPEQKGVIRDFRFYTENDDQPFAFIINKQSLLFYLRPPAVESNKYALDSLVQNFDEINENTGGEWTIRINNRDDAVSVIENILLVW